MMFEAPSAEAIAWFKGAMFATELWLGCFTLALLIAWAWERACR